MRLNWKCGPSNLVPSHDSKAKADTAVQRVIAPTSRLAFLILPFWLIVCSQANGSA